MANKVNEHDQTVNLIEKCQVGPPPGSVPSPNSIPFSFFDLPWLCCPITCKRIFFYDFPYPKTDFVEKVLPNLKHSLSLTLKHFFPFSSNIIFPPKPQRPHILYSEGDTLSFIVAESTTNFNNLISHAPKDATILDPFVPTLPSPRALQDGTLLISPVAIQVTVLPNSGFTICVTFSHMVADRRAFQNFLKFWSSLCMSKRVTSSFDEGLLLSFPILARDKIEDPNKLKPNFLEEIWNMSLNSIACMDSVIPNNATNDMVRQTTVLRPEHIENLKKLVSMKCQRLCQGTSLHVSTFVVTCSLIWVSNVMLGLTHVGVEEFPNEDEEVYFLFFADCRYLSELKIPLTYFGNCLAGALVAIQKSKLVGQNGIFEAAIAIVSKIRDVQSEPYEGVEGFMSLAMMKNNAAIMTHRLLAVTGSTKFGSYETDFGWGKPKLNELLHANYPGIFSLSPCRDIDDGVEVGIALETDRIGKFNIILNELLTNTADLQD